MTCVKYPEPRFKKRKRKKAGHVTMFLLPVQGRERQEDFRGSLGELQAKERLGLNKKEDG